MGINKSPLAFEDAKEILDQAVASKHGLRVRCATHGAAIRLRARLNHFRAADRLSNKKIYESDHIMYGASVYDRLVISIPQRGSAEEMYVYVKVRTAADAGVIEELGENDAQM